MEDNSASSKALRKAAKKGNENEVLKALDEGAFVNSKDRTYARVVSY